MQSMFRAERRSLSGPRAAPTTPTAQVTRLNGPRHRVRPTFLAAALAVAAACLIALLLVAGQAAAQGKAGPAAPGGAQDKSGPSGPAESQGADGNSTGKLLVTLPWGTGPGQVGLSTPTEGLARGPEALAVAPDGRMAVLDSVNRRIVVLAPDGSFKAHLPLSLTDPRFLCVTADRLAVLDPDTDGVCLVMDWEGVVLKSYTTPRTQEPPTAVFLIDGHPWVELAHARCAPLGRVAAQAHEGRPLGLGIERGWVVATRLADGQAGLSVQAGRSACGASTTLKIGGPQKIEHITSLNSDPSGNLILGTRMAEGGILIRRMIGTTDRENASLRLPEDSGPYVGVPYVVSPDGRILRIAATTAGYSIWVHSFDVPAPHEPTGPINELDRADKTIQTNTTEEVLEVTP